MLEDNAILTMCEVITQEMGVQPENTQLSQLGRGRRVVVAKDNTAIVDRAIKGRIAHIRGETGNTDSDFDREKLQERLAKFSGGVAVVKVGATTETELREKKHRVGMPCRRPVRPSRSASCPAVASRCCRSPRP